MRPAPIRSLLLSMVALAAAGPAAALDILLCNDDGITAANIRALERRLVAAGHRVAVSAPVDNQSGTGGAMAFLQAVPPLTGSERGAVDLGLPAGAPGVGRAAPDTELHYVNGSPVAACLHGLDVVAPRLWASRGAPELVISGPNEGNNTGLVNVSSGTFSAMSYAVNRGLPAIAVSHAAGKQVKWQADLPPTHLSYEIADVVVRLVAALEAARPKDGPLLPRGTGLNVNLPLVGEGALKGLPFRLTRLGLGTEYMPVFSGDLGADPIGSARGAKAGQMGITVAKPGAALSGGRTLPRDEDPDAEFAVIAQRTAITVSVVQGVPEAAPPQVDAVKGRLGALLSPPK